MIFKKCEMKKEELKDFKNDNAKEVITEFRHATVVSQQQAWLTCRRTGIPTGEGSPASRGCVSTTGLACLPWRAVDAGLRAR